MKSSTTYLVVLNGCFLILSASEAAPRKLPPTLPPRSMAQKKTVRKSTPKIKEARKKLPPLPATGSRLSTKPVPRNPSVIAATGRSNPDAQSVGLADQRLRANATATVFSLEDTIALCLANNPQRTEAQAAVNAATANIGAVGSQGKLQVGANGVTEYGRNTQISNGLATAGAAGTGTDNGSGTGTGDGSSATTPSRSFLRFDQLSVNASLPITTGGRVRASTRQARYQAVAQIYQLAQVEQDLILNTTLSYLDVLRATQLLRVTNANLSVSQERLRIARLRYGVGASARLDVLRAQTDLADARSRRIQAVNALGTSNSNLNILLGRAPETPIRIASITRLNLPNVAYTIAPSSVLPTSQRGQASPTGTNGSRTGGSTSTGTSGASNNGNGTTGNQNGGTATSGGRANSGRNTNGRTNASTNAGSRTSAGTTSPATGIGPGSVFSGPSAPAGNISSGAIGPTNSTTPGASGNTTNQAGVPNAIGGAGANSTAGATNPTGAANPSGATTTGAGGSGVGGATATTGGTTASGVTGSTASLSSGGVSSGASAELQSLAGGTRQSLAVTQAQIGAAEAAVEIAKSGKRPQLGLNLSALLRNPATFLGNFGASIGLGLAQNLFDSRRTRSQVDTARAALLQLQARLAGQRLQVAGAIETSLLALDSAQRRQQSADAGARSAQEALRVAQIGFRSGVRTTLDLADAQAALLAAQTDAVNSRFDVADAQATLAAAVGIYTVEAQNARERSVRDEQEAAEQARRQIEILQPKPKKKRKKFLGIF